MAGILQLKCSDIVCQIDFRFQSCILFCRREGVYITRHATAIKDVSRENSVPLETIQYFSSFDNQKE